MTKSFALGKGFTFAWDDVTNSDVDYYELRYDQNLGAAYNLLARAQGTSITLESMPARKATIYLYAHNATKKYSYPASLSYDYPVLAAPGGLTIEKAILAVNISVPDIPTGADGVRLYIEHQPIDIGKNTHYTYSNQAGIYTVTACYYDIFGEGYQTAERQAAIDPYIDPKYIEDESISLKKVDGTIKTAVSDAQQAIPRLDTLDANVTELKKTDGEILSTVAENKKISDEADASLASQLKQTAESITSTVQSNKAEQDKKNQSIDVDISQLKQTAESITSTVQSNKKELSSQISQNADKITSVVTNLSDTQKASTAYSAIAQMVNAIQMRVTADNLKEMGQSGQLMSYINLTPTAVSILSELLHITADTLIDGNVITNGMIKAGAITADKLAASVIELTASQGIKGGGATLDVNGLTVRATDGSYVVHGGNGMEFHDGNGNTFAMVGATIMGTVKDGQWVKFTKPWKTVPNVIVTPISLQTAIPGYNSTNLYLDCRAQNITTNGFRAVCRTVLKAGSGGNIPANATLISISYNGPTTSMSYNAPGGNKDCGSGFKSPDYNTIERYDTHTVSIPTDATECNFIVSADISASGWYGSYTYDTSLHISVQILKGSVSIYGPVEICSASTNNPNNVKEYTTYGSSTKTINCKASGDITVKIRTWFDMKTGSNEEYQKASKGNIKVVLSSYSFNTTADVPLASGNAFFLCTDQHNSPYTISDS